MPPLRGLERPDLPILVTMKMRFKHGFCLLALLVVVSSAELYNTLDHMVLESKDVQFFKVEELPGTRPTRLRISGLAFKSAMAVRKITTEEDGTAVVVLVHLSLAKRGTSGSFMYDLPVPDSVNEVRFGSSKVSIWRRGTGVHVRGSPPGGVVP
jgi:hypothetical protein